MPLQPISVGPIGNPSLANIGQKIETGLQQGSLPGGPDQWSTFFDPTAGQQGAQNRTTGMTWSETRPPALGGADLPPDAFTSDGGKLKSDVKNPIQGRSRRSGDSNLLITRVGFPVAMQRSGMWPLQPKRLR